MIVKIQMKISLTLLILKFTIFTPEESSRNWNNFDKSSFLMLHLNIRSLQKNFDSLSNLLMTLKFEFKVICITETWCSDNSMNHNFIELPQCKSIHQVRRTGKTQVYWRYLGQFSTKPLFYSNISPLVFLCGIFIVSNQSFIVIYYDLCLISVRDSLRTQR